MERSYRTPQSKQASSSSGAAVGPLPSLPAATPSIITALGRPEALQPSAASAVHMAQLLSFGIKLLEFLNSSSSLLLSSSSSSDPPSYSMNIGTAEAQGQSDTTARLLESIQIASSHLMALISHPQLLRVLRAHLRTGDPPAALPAVRLLALLLSIPLSGGSGGGFLSFSSYTGAQRKRRRQNTLKGRGAAGGVGVAEGCSGSLASSQSVMTCTKMNTIKDQLDLVIKRLHAGVLATPNSRGGAGGSKRESRGEAGGSGDSTTSASGRLVQPSLLPSPLLGELWAMMRAQDPLLTPPCVACLHALSCGPCWSLAATMFVVGDGEQEEGDSCGVENANKRDVSASSLLFLLRKLFATAQHRGSAEAIFSCLLSSGSRVAVTWAQKRADIIEQSIVGSAWLLREWNAVKHL